MTAELLCAVNKIAMAAVRVEKGTGVPAELITVQCCLESGYLNHAPGNNCFGIKYYTGAPDKQLLTTREWFNELELKKFLDSADGRAAVSASPKQVVKDRTLYIVKDWFAAFPDLEACFVKHALLISVGRPYVIPWAKYLADKNVSNLIDGIGKIYATDPTYTKRLHELVANPAVAEAIKTARAL